MALQEAMAEDTLARIPAGTYEIASSLESGCQPSGFRSAYALRALSEKQLRLVEALAEAIVPETETPGAAGAGVPAFIDELLADWYPAEDGASFIEGVDAIGAHAQSAFGGPLADQPSDAQARYVAALDQAAHGLPAYEPSGEGDSTSTKRPSVQQPTPFDPAALGDDTAAAYASLKKLVIEGYYTSEVGQTVELHRAPLGQWKGDVPYAEIGKAWV